MELLLSVIREYTPLILSYAYLPLYLLAGIGIVQGLMAQYSHIKRIWWGGLVGFMLAMWLPGLLAFAMGFTPQAQWFALAIAMAAGAVGWWMRPKDKAPVVKDEFWALAVLVPLGILVCVLFYNHILLPDADGNLWVGQSTFGDLNMHLGMITSLAGQRVFPPEYSIAPGNPIRYPFLVNALSASLFQLGMPLRWSVIFPSCLMSLWLFAGFFFLAQEVLGGRAKAIMASVLFFLGSGFGFAYFFDGAQADPTRFTRIFTAFYETPTNLTAEGNVYWVNAICDMIVPQRTTMAGWMMLFGLLWLLYRLVRQGGKNTSLWLLLGVMAGALPMVHTHSFFALGLISLAWLWVYRPPKGIWTWRYLKRWLLFGGITVLLAAPQLLIWTFQQASEGGFLKLHFNWVNNRDPWLWFWIKNIGLPLFLIIPALIRGGITQRRFYAGIGLLFVISELILFQPNSYDNNKLFFVWYGFTAILVSGYLVDAFRRIKPAVLRVYWAALIVTVCCLGSILTIGREWVSRYQLFSASDMSAATYIIENTEQDALFLTDNNHNNLVAVMTGRNILLGSPSFLYFHGIEYGAEEQAVAEMFTDMGRFEELTKIWKIDYVYYGGHERMKYPLAETWLDVVADEVYGMDGIKIYKVR